MFKSNFQEKVDPLEIVMKTTFLKSNKNRFIVLFNALPRQNVVIAFSGILLMKNNNCQSHYDGGTGLYYINNIIIILFHASIIFNNNDSRRN